MLCSLFCCISQRSVFLWFQGEDLDFWLSTTPLPAAAPAPEEPGVNAIIAAPKEEDEEPQREEQGDEEDDEDNERDPEKVRMPTLGVLSGLWGELLLAA